MKVILLQNVNKVGKKDQIVEVSIGYANNFLFPRKLAVAYTPKSVEILDEQKANEAKRQAELKAEAEKLKATLANIVLDFKVKTGKDGKMFGSISTKQVCEQLKSKYNIDLDKKKFVEKIDINTLGYAILKNELYKGVVAEIKVHVGEEGK